MSPAQQRYLHTLNQEAPSPKIGTPRNLSIPGSNPMKMAKPPRFKKIANVLKKPIY